MGIQAKQNYRGKKNCAGKKKRRNSLLLISIRI